MSSFPRDYASAPGICPQSPPQIFGSYPPLSLFGGSPSSSVGASNMNNTTQLGTPTIPGVGGKQWLSSMMTPLRHAGMGLVPNLNASPWISFMGMAFGSSRPGWSPSPPELGQVMTSPAVTNQSQQRPSGSIIKQKFPTDVKRDYVFWRGKLENQEQPVPSIGRESAAWMQTRFPSAVVTDRSTIWSKWWGKAQSYLRADEWAKLQEEFPPAQWALKQPGRQGSKVHVRFNLESALSHDDGPDSSAQDVEVSPENSAQPPSHEANAEERAVDVMEVGMGGSDTAEPSPDSTTSGHGAALLGEARDVSLRLEAGTGRGTDSSFAADALLALQPLSQLLHDAGFARTVRFGGHGSYGSVVLLKNQGATEYTVALKVSARPATLERVLHGDLGREAAAYWKCTLTPKRFAPRPVSIFDGSWLGCVPDKGHDGLYFGVLVMEAGYRTGPDIMREVNGHFQDKGGNVDDKGWALLWAVFGSAVEVLAEAHDSGLALRDFKPENLLVFKVPRKHSNRITFRDADGIECMIYLIDFGVAMFGEVDYKKAAQVPPEQAATVRGSPLGSKRARTALLGSMEVSNGEPREQDPVSEVSLRDVVDAYGLISQVPVGARPERQFFAAGTPRYTAPEIAVMARQTSRVTVTTDMLQAADLWAYGICLGDALATGGHMLKVMNNTHDQHLLSVSQDHALWHSYLNKAPLNSQWVPESWLKPIRFLRALLKTAPSERMTARQALQEPQFRRAITRSQKATSSAASNGGRGGGGKGRPGVGAR